MMRKLLFLMIVVMIAGCKPKPNSLGKLDEIYVFADSTDWQDYRDAIHSHFMKEYLTPVPEPEYIMKWRPFEDFSKYHYQNNVFFLARLNADDPVSKEINGLLGEDVVQGVKSGDYFYIPKKDVWALNQYVVFLVAPDKEAMIQRLYDLGELVYDDFEKSYYQRLKKQMFERGEDDKLAEYISNNFPFTLRIQHDYKLVDESESEHYLWLRRIYPDRDRSLTVRWIPDADSITISPSWLIKKRNELAAQIHSGDVVVEQETIAEQVRFQKWPAMRLEGTWKNPKRMIGGPFRTIAFKDSESSTIYIIDFYVQAIGERKKPYLDQLDVIAHTFQLETEKG